MKVKLEELNIEELERNLAETKEELRKERFKAVTSKVDNPKRIRQLRKHIARVLTLKRARDLGIKKTMK